MIGETLNGKYRIVRLMGGGGMGAVYEAAEIAGGRRVAIKVINSGDVSKDKALIGRFQRETQATSAIDTAHIVGVFETGTSADTGHPFMVMEYLVGEDLSHLFKRLRAQLSPDLTLRIGAQACLGLEKAHGARIIHRDIKPANLFLASQPDSSILVKLLDFGIAKMKMDHIDITDSKSLTKTGSMIGSPLYMSPEQARGSKTIDHRADIWSLGIVLYQALTGRTPNQDIDALGELIIAICSEPPTPVQQFAPWVPPEVAGLVHQALRFDPGERFQSAREMFEAIKLLLPNGWDLRPEMLNSVNSDQRAQVAPVLDVARSNPPPRLGSSASFGLRVTTGGSVRATSGTTDPATPPPSATHGLGESGTPLGIANNASTTQSRAPVSRVPLIITAAVVVGIGVGLGVYKAVTPKETPVVATAPAPPSASAKPTTPPPSTTPATTATATTTTTTTTATATASASAQDARSASPPAASSAPKVKLGAPTGKPTSTATAPPPGSSQSPGLKDKFE